MEIITGTADSLPAGVHTALARYRHRVFVEMLGWRLASRDGMELDQFDRPDTLYVVARRHHGEIMGMARLLATDRPYLLGEIFPQLLGEVPPPRTPAVWELSRFAAVDFAAGRRADSAERGNQCPSRRSSGRGGRCPFDCVLDRGVPMICVSSCGTKACRVRHQFLGTDRIALVSDREGSA
ncbi:N-acyl-L-homoserine lactone synthetase [Variovorax sp. HW608]|uniref:acyl-homoserine-lactone synthase n=1 Tax=Variovorax sp. HW608 TaxID=1034889 RepID=UPI00081FB4A6|nr:acyl-homoserine-lactone synthase [Variovorax sp. HW608]SCK35394.1 N-acyl-L-homoserine lactone synthetase [Variovorax sp. HW608]